jgi:acyl-CoA thioester hydrolase
MARVKLEIPVDKIFTIGIKVRISDINYGNHVGNDALVSIIHEARMQWLSHNNFTELNIGDAALIMVDLAVEYKAESFYGDTLNVAISIGEITKISFEIFYEITTTRNDKKILIANAKTGMVCFDYETKKVTRVPNAFLTVIETIVKKSQR